MNTQNRDNAIDIAKGIGIIIHFDSREICYNEKNIQPDIKKL